MAALPFIAHLACGGGPATSTVYANVALVLPDGALVSEIGYAVYAADGTTVLYGTKDYTDRSTPLALNLSLTPGAGYVLELAATSVRGDACDGVSAPFTVAPDQSTTVTLTLGCDPTHGYQDQCPIIQAWSAIVEAAPAPPGTIDLSAFATDQDAGDVVTYSWTAASGTFTDASAAATVYTCASTSPALVTLTVNDNHQPEGCITTAQLPVGCGAPQP